MAQDIAQWLNGLGLGRYVAAFRDAGIDFDILPSLSDDDLKELDVNLGDRRRIQRAIQSLSSDETELSVSLPAKKQIDPQTGGERRQLTVMFCDMAGSTALSARLDPEDLRETLRGWRERCRAAIKRYDGFIAKYMGDGILAYFGYPRAHEDDAERAVRAGLAIAAAMVANRHDARAEGQTIAVRIGIATGQVVVGDIIGEGASEEASVTGETPNLAARLQEVAPPDTVVVAPATRRLVGGTFSWADLGEHAFKGFDAPVRAWQVTGESSAESRFEARGPGLTPLVGRDEEADLLVRRWRRAVDGEGQLVLVSGEAGIGKSRLIETLRERIAVEPHFRLRYQCSPHHVNSALYPVIARLERAARFERADTDEARLDKLESLLTVADTPDPETVLLFANLLSVPTSARYPALDMEPRRKKERTLAALIAQVRQLAKRRPVLFTFEDAHWADPTTLELLDLIAADLAELRIVLVITYRPDFAAPWAGRPHTTVLSLNRLGGRDCRAMCERVTGGRALPDDVLDQIVEKTDGVPLFVEELTKTVLESGLLREEAGRYMLTGPLPDLAIPASLHDALMARLDRLAPVREVAQTAAVIGREFRYELLAHIAPMTDAGLDDALGQLASAELIYARGSPPDATYTFKHALVQDAAYASLLRSRRRELHQRIARALEEHFPQTAETEPELLAHHYSEAGLAGPAAEYWYRAGRAAAGRFATRETVEHFNRALGALADISDDTERLRRELDVQTLLAPILVAVHGNGSDPPKRAYERARALAEDIGDAEALFGALWGLWHVHNARGDRATATRLVDELLAHASHNQDPAYELQAHHAAWGGPFDARYAEDLAHIERGLALYDPKLHHAMAPHFGGHDAGVCCHAHAALALWATGHPEQSLKNAGRAWALAQEVAHPPSIAHAAAFSAYVYLNTEDWPTTRRFAETAIEIGRESGSVVFVNQALPVYGLALANLGEPEEGLVAIDEGLAHFRAMPTGTALAYFTAVRAEACALGGRTGEALALLDEALVHCGRNDAHGWEPNIHRLKGEVLLSLSHDRGVEAERCFESALAVARSQGARMWELRAATSLARLWRSNGRAEAAHDLLAPLYGWFTEGFETADLRKAKALLNALG